MYQTIWNDKTIIIVFVYLQHALVNSHILNSTRYIYLALISFLYRLHTISKIDVKNVFLKLTSSMYQN